MQQNFPESHKPCMMGSLSRFVDFLVGLWMELGIGGLHQWEGGHLVNFGPSLLGNAQIHKFFLTDAFLLEMQIVCWRCKLYNFTVSGMKKWKCQCKHETFCRKWEQLKIMEMSTSVSVIYQDRGHSLTRSTFTIPL